MAKTQRSSWFAGFVTGGVAGLALAAAVAYLLANGPVPFQDKVEKVTADVDPAQVLAGGVDPNAALNNGGLPSAPANEPDDGVATVHAGEAPERDAQGKAVAPGQVTAHEYWVQAGAFAEQDHAVGVQAQLALQGIQANLSRIGNTWRVRVGPFNDLNEAREVQTQISNDGATADLSTTIVEQ